MPQRRTRDMAKPKPQEEGFMMHVEEQFELAKTDPNFSVYAFSKELTKDQRAYIHYEAREHGLKSTSYRKEPERYITVSKLGTWKSGCARKPSLGAGKSGTKKSEAKKSGLDYTDLFDVDFNRSISKLKVTSKSMGILHNFSSKPELKLTGRNPSHRTGVKADFGGSCGPPKIPPLPKKRDGAASAALPIAAFRQEIVGSVLACNAVLISGETGCGKTTQVPQMILEECTKRNEPCRIFCTQPRRLAAVAMADRVASERGERLGDTVGYQIRLDNNVSSKTVLTYSTCGVLLRIMMGSGLKNITHVIVDEVHERDKFCDFLMTALKLALPQYPSLKLILMSASMDTELFAEYFNCPVLSVPGRVFEVEEFFLEDILQSTNYTTPRMASFMRSNNPASNSTVNFLEGPPQLVEIDEWDSGTSEQIHVPAVPHPTSVQANQGPVSQEDLEDWIVETLDSSIESIFRNGDTSTLYQITHLVTDEGVSIDYQHTENGVTALMAACAHGLLDTVQMLVMEYNASPAVRAPNGITALNLAERFGHSSVVQFLQEHASEANRRGMNGLSISSEGHSSAAAGVIVPSVDPAQAMKDEWNIHVLLESYHKSLAETNDIDNALILHLLSGLMDEHEGDSSGAVLIFLPGYREITSLRDLIIEEMDQRRYVLFVLHSSIPLTDQRKVFKSPPPRQRKIILSTNIAETSLTINDVVFVIDSGRVKEKAFEALGSINSLNSNWISKANSLQRKGRAGRCRKGVCYHLFSRARYENMPQFQVPELLRTPLQEMVLQTKLLSVDDASSFLSSAPQPPGPLLIDNALKLLMAIGALDEEERLTELGRTLVELPMDPSLAKCLLAAVLLKCLDPVLTIVCSINMKDPFILPIDPEQQQRAKKAKHSFAADSFSDHMVFWSVFEEWQQAHRTSYGAANAFCRAKFLSPETLKTISETKDKLFSTLTRMKFMKDLDVRVLNSNSRKWPVIKGALSCGLYPSIAQLDRSKPALVTPEHQKAFFHPSSVLWNYLKKGRPKAADPLPFDWFIFQEVSRMGTTTSLHCGTPVSPLTVALFCCGTFRSKKELLDVNELFSFSGSLQVLSGVNWLSEHLSDILLRLLKNEAEVKAIYQQQSDSQVDQSAMNTLEAVSKLLCAEDETSVTLPNQIGEESGYGGEWQRRGNVGRGTRQNGPHLGSTGRGRNENGPRYSLGSGGEGSGQQWRNGGESRGQRMNDHSHSAVPEGQSWRSNCRGAASVGSRGRGVDSVGSRGRGAASVGSRGRGVASVGSRGRGVDSLGSRGRGVASVGSRGRGVDSVGSRGRGVASVGSRGRGVDSLGSRGRGAGSVGSRGRAVGSAGSWDWSGDGYSGGGSGGGGGSVGSCGWGGDDCGGSSGGSGSRAVSSVSSRGWYNDDGEKDSRKFLHPDSDRKPYQTGREARSQFHSDRSASKSQGLAGQGQAGFDEELNGPGGMGQPVTKRPTPSSADPALPSSTLTSWTPSEAFKNSYFFSLRKMDEGVEESNVVNISSDVQLQDDGHIAALSTQGHSVEDMEDFTVSESEGNSSNNNNNSTNGGGEDNDSGLQMNVKKTTSDSLSHGEVAATPAVSGQTESGAKGSKQTRKRKGRGKEKAGTTITRETVYESVSESKSATQKATGASSNTAEHNKTTEPPLSIPFIQQEETAETRAAVSSGCSYEENIPGRARRTKKKKTDVLASSPYNEAYDGGRQLEALRVYKAGPSGPQKSYFVMRCPGGVPFLDSAIAKGVWITSATVQNMLNRAYQQTPDHVILFVLMPSSETFRGAAKLLGPGVGGEFPVWWEQRSLTIKLDTVDAYRRMSTGGKDPSLTPPILECPDATALNEAVGRNLLIYCCARAVREGLFD